MALTRIAGLCLPFLASVFAAHPDHSITVQLDPPGPYVAPTAEKSRISHDREAVLALTAVMFGECRGQGITCMDAVGHVVLSRAKAHLPARYGKGIAGVVGKPGAFSCISQRDPNWRVIQAGLEGRLLKRSPDAIAWTMALGRARIILGPTKTIDPTKGSTHYFAATIHPAWEHDRGMVRVASIGGHVFMRKAV